ncbi:hypothetical protein M3I54_38755 [Paraburkholderia sp. CNPSo 3274]|uniref:hypothetical protein n=1 Tax=Paraburkholderia sp. CNPSo 3274 TaxID=2940932 RepID=UPI0020B6B181|nr:hypothetical protein [Paraburkholderia sp. CNPSo 3274]MCP3712779.1 hypothetical protein [Paraburkholderia sp. CNPSo 3274]
MALFAAVKWFVLTQPMPGAMKQHLALTRIVNFIGIAMVAAYFVHRQKDKARASVKGAGCG